MTVIALSLPADLAAAIDREAAQAGMTSPAWIVDRLVDRFAVLPSTSEARS